MTDDPIRQRFAEQMLPHLDAAHNLARWLTRNDHDAQDVVQDAYLRALRYFGAFRGERARAWLLQIVRHTTYTWLKTNRPAELVTGFDDDDDALAAASTQARAPLADEPHNALASKADRAALNQALAALPIALREVLVLRELEELSYKDIARIVDVPIGTVMSRLSRARAQLLRALDPALGLALHPASDPAPDPALDPNARPLLRAVPGGSGR